MEEKFVLIFVGHCLMRAFDPNSIDYLKWLNSFEYMIEVTKTPENRKTDVLLKMLIPDVVEELKNSMAPVNPSERPYEEIVLELQKKYSKYKGETAAVYRFQKRDQLPQEPVQHFVLALRKLLSKFTHPTNHQEFLKQRFIEGLENEETKALLKEQSKDISFPKAISIAKQRELINKEIKKTF